ncbi:hypothetical protein RF11_06197 [Thelohanellus kitauei]|uniref:Uncharacterized protein n=1 Tax=Thelohanellus kitauei TaxID=669202 RepID=A0A0C2MPW4_THEKT|nr:hypothetical protein RF11_06197 [Thelohanellus kitauei]
MESTPSIQFAQIPKPNTTKMVSFNLSETLSPASLSENKREENKTESSVPSPRDKSGIRTPNLRRSNRFRMSTFKRNNPGLEESGSMLGGDIIKFSHNSLPTPILRKSDEKSIIQQIIDVHSRLLDNHVQLVNHIIGNTNVKMDENQQVKQRLKIIKKITKILSTKTYGEICRCLEFVSSIKPQE